MRGVIVIHRPHDRQTMGLPRQQRKVLADRDPRHTRRDAPKRSANILRRIRLGIPRVKLAGTTPHENQEARSGPAKPIQPCASWSRLSPPRPTRQTQSRECERPDRNAWRRENASRLNSRHAVVPRLFAYRIIGSAHLHSLLIHIGSRQPDCSTFGKQSPTAKDNPLDRDRPARRPLSQPAPRSLSQYWRRVAGQLTLKTLAPRISLAFSSTSARLASARAYSSTSGLSPISAASRKNSLTSDRVTLATLLISFSRQR